MIFLIGLILIVAMSTPETVKYKYKRAFWFASKLDDTDNLKTGDRSNLALYIDHGTGVHYIRTPFGSLIPRLDAYGNVVSSYQQSEIIERVK